MYPSRPKIPLDILRIGALILSISTFSSGSLAKKAKLNYDFRVKIVAIAYACLLFIHAKGGKLHAEVGVSNGRGKASSVIDIKPLLALMNFESHPGVSSALKEPSSRLRVSG